MRSQVPKGDMMGEVARLREFMEPTPSAEPQLRVGIFAGYEIVRENPDGSEDVVERVFEGPDGETYTSWRQAREDGRRQANWYKKKPWALEEALKERKEM
jgi:hypothetical protein